MSFRCEICKLMISWNFKNQFLGSHRSDFNNSSFILIVNHCSFKWAIVWLILRTFIFRHLLHYFAILDHCVMMESTGWNLVLSQSATLFISETANHIASLNNRNNRGLDVTDDQHRCKHISSQLLAAKPLTQKSIGCTTF